jgi:HlyD family secretion protein
VKERTKGILALVAGVAVLGLLGLAALLLARPAPESLQGEADATKVDVAAKVPGRVATIEVKEGDTVRRGDPVATLESPEIRARLDQAEAAKAGAVAQREKADRGAREEEVRAARSQWDRARHAADLAEVTFGRLDRRARDGVVPRQRRDEAEAQWKTSRDAADAAKALYDMALAGARREDRDTAAALVSRAEGAVDEVQAFLDETKVVSPAAGEVYRRNVEPGEIVPAGFPIVTLVDLSDVWVTFQVREDRLALLKMGATVPGRFPALGNDEVPLTVSFVAPQGDFATWRATSAQGGFDLKTFEVRARPAKPVPGLRPGMSAVVTWPR